MRYCQQTPMLKAVTVKGRHAMRGRQRALTNALPMAVNSGSSGFSRRTQQNSSVKPPQFPAASIFAPGCRFASASGTYLHAARQDQGERT